MTTGDPDRRTGFDDLMAEVMAGAGRFGHRQHLELAWLAVTRQGPVEAADLLCDGILRTAIAAGAPEKFDEALTRRWVALVAERVSAADDPAPDRDAAAFLARHPDLLDPHLLRRSATSAIS